MENTVVTRYKWAYLPVVFSSAAILATSAIAAPGSSQQYQDAKQVSTANYEYVGGRTQIGFGITDDGDASVDLNHVFSETENSSTSAGLWAGVDLKGDDKGIKGRGVQINHNWVARNKAGQATHVNKVFGAYDRNEAGHDKATVGYGREKENIFWEGHASKGLSGKKGARTIGGKTVSDRAYDYGVGGSIGKFIKGSNVRIRAGLDHEWGDDLGVGESRAKNTTLSAGIEKFFQGTPHSLGFDVSASKRSGGFDTGSDDTDVTSRLSYRYDFGGDIYQPNKRYKRTRVEVPGTPARYAKKAQFKRVPTYKTIPTYGKKTVRTPYKQLVKSTMELEGQTFFKLNSAKLIPSAQTRLKQIAAQIRKSGYKGSIRITGNTCGLGDPAYDQRLSEKRAKAVRNFLIKNGFNPKHLVARGLGKNHPKFPNNDAQGFKNRRVDIEYISERKEYKTAYRTEQKTVRTGSRQVASGFKNVPAGYKNVLIGKAGAPRVIWKTEAIPTSPAWIKRALHNNIKHNTSVNTYQTTSGSDPVTVMPNASDDSVTLETCNFKDINVLGNDDQGSGNAVVTITVGPLHGTATVLENGRVRYTPNDDYVGDDSFTYMITDSNGNTSSATVSLTVTAQCQGDNEAPVAVDDSAMGEKGEAVTISPLGNDSDPDGDTLTIESVANPEHGTAEIVGNQIVYHPDADFTGTETFEYTISDGHGHTSTATITVVVSEASLPEASDDNVTLETCSSKIINVLANDNQGSGNATVVIMRDPSHGEVTVLADGTIRYTPEDDYVGDDSFDYTITDSNGNSSSAMVSLTVTNQCSGNNAPIARNDSASTQICNAITLDVLSNDSDPDFDALRILSVSGMSLGTAIILDNKILYTPSESCGTGIDNFSYTITDDNDHTASASIRMTVTEDVVLPPNVANDRAKTDQEIGITIDVLANDDDHLMVIAVTQPANGYVEKLSNGEISYLPNDGFHGIDTFTYTAKNAAGRTAQASVRVKVKKVTTANRAPNANQDSRSTTINENIVIDVLANDTDPDGDTLTIDTVTQPPQGATVSISSDNKIHFNPNGIAASNTFTYTVTDGQGHTDETTVTVSVTDPNAGNNHWPLVTGENVTTSKGDAITIDVLANDTDADGDVLILDQVDSGSNGTTQKVGGMVLYTPNPGFTGTDEFWYGVHDGHGHNGSGKVTVTVTP